MYVLYKAKSNLGFRMKVVGKGKFRSHSSPFSPFSLYLGFLFVVSFLLGFLVIYCYIIITPKFSNLIQQTFIFCGWGMWEYLAWWFWLRIFHEVSITMLVGLRSSDSLTGTVGSTSKMVHSHDFWQEDLVPHHMDCSIGFLVFSWQLAFP